MSRGAHVDRIGKGGDDGSFGAAASPAALRSLFERVIGQAPFGFALYDPGLRYVLVNEVMAGLNGRSARDHVGRTVFEVVPALADPIARHLQEVLDTGEAVEDREVSGVTPGDPDRHRVWLNSFYPVTGADGALQGVAAVARDVTESRRMQEQLATEQFRSALEALLHPLMLASVRPSASGGTELRVEYLNPAASEVTGLRREDAVGRLLPEVFPVVAGLGIDRDYERVFRTGVPFVARDLPYGGGDAPSDNRFDVSVTRIPTGIAISWRTTELETRLVQQQLALRAERGRVAQLQRSFLPRRLPALPGTALAARYRSAERDAALGGDWYDAAALDDRLAVVIGDVAGHGMGAVETMGVARITTRAYLAEDTEPATVLARLDRYLGRTWAPPAQPLMTMVATRYDPADRTLRWSNAGHPPPLLVDRDGARLLGSVPQPPIGACRARREGNEVVLQPGSTVVLYTDGLVERRGENLDDGLDRLVAAGSSPLPDDAGSVCDLLLERCLDPRFHDDDVCLVVLQAP